MFVQSQDRDASAPVVLRSARPGAPEILLAPIASVASSGPSSKDAPPGQRRDDAIVGHLLADGWMAVHAPGQPCGYCDGTKTSRPRPVT